MTWSIVARDPAGDAWGVAVASRFFAVGSLCPHVRPGAGALSTQALINPTYGPRGLDLLAGGATASDVIAGLITGDEGRAARQLHVVDAQGRAAAHTGADCIGWCGHRGGENLSVAGNMLAGPEVIDATCETYLKMASLPFAERLLTAMEAGETAGGDKRGKQSACLVIHTGEAYPSLSLRADDHVDPLAELRRLYRVSQGRYAAFMSFLPTRDNPCGVFDRAVIEAEVQRREAMLAQAEKGAA
ncbi:DUF1028 domain-containing protein [Ferrovibrio xuzhouensis]|uniref:DUF1028 domain-containing protein n=1 Tax=Ferrovibrio xuzhouensis TaxID=1576914 RepID=A0ABV7VLH8_9PROT